MTMTPVPVFEETRTEIVPQDRLAVVMCVWKRPELLAGTLTMLAAQTDQEFDLFLVNNNGELREFVEKTVAASDLSLKTSVQHNPRNEGSFAKLVMAYDLANRERDWIVLIDDDFTFGPTFLAQLRAQRLDDAIVSWRVHTAIPGRNYWERTKTAVGAAGSYAEGTGTIIPAGAVCDAEILTLSSEFWPADNLWMSYIADKRHYRCVQGDIQGCSLIIDNKDQYIHYTEMKVRFLNYLRGRGWKV